MAQRDQDSVSALAEDLAARLEPAVRAYGRVVPLSSVLADLRILADQADGEPAEAAAGAAGPAASGPDGGATALPDDAVSGATALPDDPTVWRRAPRPAAKS
ncbi:hypothetical protein [Micromonospora sp. DT31]|uniref:hypothetical protein n=1 Tax=Micromonospora sp. DT31 TaxID=3393434 RepID=UPI003CF489B5